MLKSYKTEINPTPQQMGQINCTIGVCRYIYNLYIGHNKEIYEKEKRFVSASEFSTWLNNEFIPNHPEYGWIEDVSSKAVKQSIINAEKAFKNFFKGYAGFPKFKKKNKSDVKMYFVKNDGKTIISCQRHRIKIPTLGWVQIKEKGYLPTNPQTHTIKSGTVSRKAGRYYVSIVVEETGPNPLQPERPGVGVDLGLKEFAVCSDGTVYKNINKTSRIRKMEKKLKREQRRLSRKYESLKKNKTEGGAARQNIQKQTLKVQKMHQRLTNMRTDYINKVISEMVKTRPEWITIEDLNVSGMMKNRHLSKAVAQQKFYEFRNRLTAKCKVWGIELRIADRYYPSSKTCYHCKQKKSDLKLSDRTYHCDQCGYTKDRDLNASLNLKDCPTYSLA